jgi:hypothetical protein
MDSNGCKYAVLKALERGVRASTRIKAGSLRKCMASDEAVGTNDSLQRLNAFREWYVLSKSE